MKDLRMNFVEKEVKKFQQKFNQLFGERIVCNLQIRYSVILSICWLGVLGKKIMETKDKEKSMNLMKEFVKAKGSLRRFFDKVESSYEAERSRQNARDINQTIRQEACQHTSSGA